ncbi:MAG: sugar phosphate nucleotidyltransferase [Myxococcota bacterium]
MVCPWVIVLAGGDGRRLESVAVGRYGYARPKQFCDFGAGTLLARTLHRASHVAPPERVVVVTSRHHRPWAAECLAPWPAVRWVEQPSNRDTTPGLLLPLLHVLEADPDATVVVLPSDHFVDDDARFMEAAREAAESVDEEPHAILLLGANPGDDADGYGWIVPAPGAGRWPAVAAFREKPEVEERQRLMERGALVNTFVMVARARAMAALAADYAPEWLAALRVATRDPARLDAVYSVLPPNNWSRVVLEHARERLRLVPLREVGWDDIGTPERLARALEQTAAAG